MSDFARLLGQMSEYRDHRPLWIGPCFNTYSLIQSFVTSDKQDDESDSPEEPRIHRPTKMSRKEAREQTKRKYKELGEVGGKIRPHIELDLSRGAFEDGLGRAIDGETVHIDEDDWVVTLDPMFIESGHISLSGDLRQYVESSLSDNDLEHPFDIGTPSMIEEYYHDGAASIQEDIDHYDIKRGYATLVRDMSVSCAQAVDMMRDAVDEHPDLIWGKEPTISNTEGAYGFSGTIYYRPFDK